MITRLDNRSILKISGNDAQIFLQSQFSNDINKIVDKEIQLNAYCQHQGKVIALLWVFKKNNFFYISLPNDIKDIVIAKLNTFKMMSDVMIEEFSSQINQYGLIDENFEDSYKIKNNLSLITTRKSIAANNDYRLWEKACIDNNLPEISIENSEKFIPQALNLDINEIGVSFTKGCYPGQEIVARMHYLGESKRRLFQFISEFEASIGDSINAKDSKSLKSSGVVIRVANIDENYHLMATFEINYINDLIYLNNDTNKPITIVNA